MLLWTILKVALKALSANKLRSVLAMLGIIIGVGAVISMLALGAGAEKQVLSRIESMGTNLLIVRPGLRGARGVRSATERNLTVDDAKAILDEVEGIAAVAPVARGSAQLKALSRNARASVIGTSVPYFEARSFEVERGRPFTEIEVERGQRVCVLGPATVENLFGAEDPLERTVKVDGRSFLVVGVLKAKGDQGWFNPDDQVVMPYTTAMRQLLGVDYLGEISIQCDPDADLDALQAEVEEVLRRRHRLRPGEPDDFNVRNQAELLETASSVSRTFTLLLGGIASISLLVGGIGIMNIMLVTVTERTREIGVRKAIGAKDRDVLGQFLIEAVLLSGIGGILGVGLGVGGAAIATRLSPFEATVDASSVLIALSFSAAVGIFFGFAPARRAAKLDPIEALRYE